MPRKKTIAAKPADVLPAAAEAETIPALESIPQPIRDKVERRFAEARESSEAAVQTEETPKNWGPPYKAIYTSPDKGFELGENRRYKQRVFTFKDRPDDATIAALKENGFMYRAAEKSWTIQADAASRLMSDRLAKEFAGESQSMTR